MAAPILLASELGTTDVFLGGTFTAGDLAIVVIVGWNGTAGSNVPTASLSSSGLYTYTKRERAGLNGNKDVYVCIAHATVTASGSETVAIDLTNSSNHACLLYRVPGGTYVQHTSATGDTYTADPTTFTATLASPPSSSNGVLLAFGITEAFDGQNTIAPASGWTELNGNEDGTLVDLSYMTAWREGSTSQSCSVLFNKDEYVEVMVAVEISAVTNTNITASTVGAAVELPAVSATTTASIAASTVTVVSELPAAALSAAVSISASTIEIVAELPLATIPAADINAAAVVAVAELPTVAVDIYVPIVDITANTITVTSELPQVTAANPDQVSFIGTVTVQAELLTVTVGGDATAGPAPLWRIRGYPAPSRIGPVTRR